MIKSHRPTGHFWTCASEFQQSRKYRNIETEDFATPFAKPLVVDSDEPSTKSGRAAKRRRLENLAKGFLDGKALYIASAEANSAELGRSLEGALRARELSRKDVEVDLEEEACGGEEGWRVIRDRNARRRRGKPSLQTNLPVHKAWNEASGVRECIMSARIPQPGRSKQHISTTPSEAAIARAAKFRSRGRLLAQRNLRQLDDSSLAHIVVPQSAPPSARATRPFKLYEAPHLAPATPADDTLADELRLSRTESPSRRPKALVVVPTKSMSFTLNDTVDTVEDTPGRNCMLREGIALADAQQIQRSPEIDGTNFLLNTKLESDGSRDEDQPDKEQVTSSTGSALGSTAMSLCTVFPKSTAGEPGVDPGIDNLDAVLEPRKVWTAINDPDLRTSKVPLHDDADSSRRQAIGQLRLTLLESSAAGLPGSAKTTFTKPSTSAVKTTRRRKALSSLKTDSDPALPSGQRKLMDEFKLSKAGGCMAAPASQSGTTPFVYRKKARLPRVESPQTPCQPGPMNDRSSSHPVDHALSASQENSLSSRSHGKTPVTWARPPVLDLSFGDDSSFAPRLNMALVDDHLARRLPTSSNSARRSSSAKKALKDLMRANGAEFERAPGEPPSSQIQEPDEPSHHGGTVDDSGTLRRISSRGRRSTAMWPGTQILLNQAQEDMFTSPEKEGYGSASDSRQGEPMSEPTYHTVYGKSEVYQATYLPLGHRSPERLPATQALMETWSPWSTVKKPGTTKRASSVPSPLASKEGLPSTKSSHPDLRSTLGYTESTKQSNEFDSRRSGLQCSGSATDSPSYSSTNRVVIPLSVTDSELLGDTTARQVSSARPRSPISTRITTPPETEIDFMNTSFAAAAVQGWEDDTAKISSGDDLSSFQAPPLPHDSNPERTLADLATEFLSTADMGQALSQV